MEILYLFPMNSILREDLTKFLFKEEHIKQLDKIPPLIENALKREIRLYNDKFTNLIYFIIRDRNDELGETKTVSLSSKDLEKY